jgi:hypothetical protein
MPEKFPVKSVQVALTGTTYATLVAAPPTDVAYRITKVFGQNNAGGARTLYLAFNDGGTRTIIWETASVGDGVLFSGTAGAEQFNDIGVVLSATDHSLDMKLDDTGTDTIVCSYEILEA